VPGSGERTLEGITLFEGLDQAEHRRIEALCMWRRYSGRERILDWGSESRDVFFVVQGSVNIVNFMLSGREVTFATIGAGSCFGELSAIDGQPRSASVVAVETSLLASLASRHFLDLLRRHSEVSIRVLQRLAQMVRASDVRIMELSTLAATSRVYAELLRMAQPDAGTKGMWAVRQLPPVRDIASRVGTTRETAARALSQLYLAGLAKKKGRNLYILDRVELEKTIDVLQLHGADRARG
jgi:CRP-like cAMP-binding protein